MKVVHISTSEKIGGAAIAANRLNEAFRNNKVNSKMLVLNRTTSKDDVITILKGRKLLFYKIKALILQILKSKILNNSYFFTLGWFGCHIVKSKLLKEADVIYIHWTGFNFLSIREIYKILSLGKPTFLFMHDMWFITGGCHHSFDCEKYEKSCNSCPIIRNKYAKNFPLLTFILKRKYLSKHKNLHIITPSVWLESCARKSSLFKLSDIIVIPNLINTNLYKPCDKRYARDLLNLPQDKKLILFGANGGKSDKYKGWDLLVSALSILKEENIAIVLFGGYLKDEEIAAFNYPVYSMGYLADEYSSVLLYNAVDVYVTPSLAESFGLTIQESIACGTYAVGFNIGGIPDIIRHKETGYLAKYKDIIDMANGIIWALNNSNENSRKELHHYILENFSQDIIIRKHKEIITRYI